MTKNHSDACTSKQLELANSIEFGNSFRSVTFFTSRLIRNKIIEYWLWTKGNYWKIGHSVEIFARGHALKKCVARKTNSIPFKVRGFFIPDLMNSRMAWVHSFSPIAIWARASKWKMSIKRLKQLITNFLNIFSISNFGFFRHREITMMWFIDI